MNERIQKLAEQQGFTGANYLISSQELEKFARLIVQECVSTVAMIGISNYDNDDISWAVDLAITQIRERFGIEQ